MTKATTTKAKKILSAGDAMHQLRKAQETLFHLSYDMGASGSDYAWRGEIDEHALCLLSLMESDIQRVKLSINQEVHDEHEAKQAEAKAERKAEREAEREANQEK